MDLASAESYLRTVENALKQADEPGVSFALIGEAVVVRRYSALARKDLTQAERVSLPITFAVLGVAFLSVIAAALPIALAVVSLVVTLAFLSLVSLNAGLSPFVLNTAAAVALGLSIDHPLFVVTRFREERQAAATVDEAIVQTMGTTGRAVMLSGLTVSAAMSALAAVGVGLFSSMAAAGIIAQLGGGARGDDVAARDDLPAR